MKKNLLEKLSFNQQIIFFALGALMSVVSIYLTSHYFDAKYPVGFEASSVCNINSFFNCDATTLSPLGNIAGIPISIFGVLIGAFIMLFYLFKNEEMESALFYTLCANAAGCLFLFAYSLIFLGTLCPFCTLYYILSFAATFMIYKYSDNKNFSAKGMGIYAVATIIVAGASYASINQYESKKIQMADSLVTMFNNSPKLGEPSFNSPLRLASATKDFKEAPIQMTIFSDFQCPACKALHQAVDKLITKYKGKINVQYFFYPLDHNCNPKMKGPLHTLACQAAYVAYCAPRENFKNIHDRIFENQQNLSGDMLSKMGAESNSKECIADPKTKDYVVKMINEGDAFGVQSTPTSIINGVKIEGVRPLSDYYAIFDSLIRN